MRGATLPRLALVESSKAITRCFAVAIAKLLCRFPKACPSGLLLVDQGCVMHLYPRSRAITINLIDLIKAGA